MISLSYRTILLLAFFMAGLSCLRSESIKVGVVIEPPFIYQNDDSQYEGLSIQLWEDIAKEGNLEYEYQLFTDALAAVRALTYNEIDISINPNGINPKRLELLDATQPFYISSTGIAVPRVKRSRFREFISNFFSYNFLRIIGFLGLIIFSFGTLLWLVERKRNKHQFRPGLMGLLDGLWWSAVTMTTVGYGDKAPKTTVGRIIAIVWMFTAIIIISGFTATIASTLTVSSFQSSVDSIEKLKSQSRIGTVEHTQSASFLFENDVTTAYKFKTPQEGLRSLTNQDITYLVSDKSELRYLIDLLQLEESVVLLSVNFNRHYRNFLLPKDSPLTSIIDPLLLERINEANWITLLKQYQLGDVE